MAPTTTSDSNKLPSGFWKAASAGLVVAAVLVSGLTGSFYGTGLPWVVEALVGALAGALCFWLFIVAPITPPVKVQYLKIERFNRDAYNSTWEPILQSYRLPLSRFDGVESRALVSILFRFDSNRGVVLLDEIGFRGAPTSFEPSNGEGGSEAQTRESGDRPAQ